MDLLESLKPHCTWCAKTTPIDPLAVVAGIAVRDEDTGDYAVRGIDGRGPSTDRMAWSPAELDAQAEASPAPVAMLGDADAWLIVDGDDTTALLADVARSLAAAREVQEAAMVAATVAVRYAVACGVSEADAARRVGVDRMTVRKMLGK